MAFHPTTDVVLDVIRAADPARASLAADRLAALAGEKPAAEFAADLTRAEAGSATAPAFAPGLTDARATLGVAARVNLAGQAKTEFEAMAIDGFVRDLLPKDSQGLFGEGLAGEVWRSLLSEQISRQIAKSGALGLSRKLFATHELATSARPSGAASPSAATSPNMVSAPAAADVVDGAILTMRGRA